MARAAACRTGLRRDHRTSITPTASGTTGTAPTQDTAISHAQPSHTPYHVIDTRQRPTLDIVFNCGSGPRPLHRFCTHPLGAILERNNERDSSRARIHIHRAGGREIFILSLASADSSSSASSSDIILSSFIQNVTTSHRWVTADTVHTEAPMHACFLLSIISR